MPQFFAWLKKSISFGLGNCESPATRLARAVRGKMKLNWRETNPKIWSAQVEPRCGYGIRLILVTCEDRLVWLTTQSLHIEREWIQQKLAVLLLELNDNYAYGSNRLVSGPSGVSLVHSHACDSACGTAEHIAEVGWTILRQMQELVTRLYAEELLPSTVEGAALRREVPSHRQTP